MPRFAPVTPLPFSSLQVYPKNEIPATPQQQGLHSRHKVTFIPEKQTMPVHRYPEVVYPRG
jgi:hypothetical protein